MARIQKIILLVLVVPLALFPGGLMVYVMLYEQLKFELLMWIPIGLSLLGICSFIFHLKTLRIYQLLRNNASLPAVEPLFWILDVLFGIAYLSVSSYLLYVVFLVESQYPLNRLLVFIVPMALVGLWTVIEAVYLHKLVQIHKFSNRQSDIEHITGETRD